MNYTHTYTILIKSSAADLSIAVNKKMADGYQPLGGVSVTMTDKDITYAQAMIKVDRLPAV